MRVTVPHRPPAPGRLRRRFGSVHALDPLRDHWLVGFNDFQHVGRVCVRLVGAWILGGIIGFNREKAGKAAGLRTHMLVCTGTALFVLAGIEAGADSAALMRIVQGVAAGIGFLGAGVILKMPEERRISGVTTAADIWVTSAVGIAAGMGFVWPAALAILLGYISLRFVRSLEK